MSNRVSFIVWKQLNKFDIGIEANQPVLYLRDDTVRARMEAGFY